MTTQQIKSTTMNFLLFEQKIKSLTEPEIIRILGEYNQRLSNSMQFSNWRLISRGGDALNYYYPEKTYIPTHDFDIGLISIPVENNLDQFTFDALQREIMSPLCRQIAKELTEHFQNNIFANEFKNLKFTYTEGVYSRLSNIMYKYNDYNARIIRDNAVMDLYIFGNVQERVFWTELSSGIKYFVPNNAYFDDKYDYQKMSMVNLRGRPLIDHLQNDLVGQEVLYKNIFNYIIKDMTSGMEYIAPGDLLTDTMRMIYQSLYNISIANNKLDKYLIKYSRLLDVINRIDSLCTGRGCNTIETTATVLRDTNGLDCNGNRITNIFQQSNVRRENLTALRRWFRHSYINSGNFDQVPTKKLCEIIEVLDQ